MTREAISEDPDVIQAVADFRGAVDEIRRRSADAARLPADDPHRAMHRERIADITSVIRLRAEERLGMTADALILLVNADLDSRARRGRPTPQRASSRMLLTALTNAQARLSQAVAAHKAAAVELEAARAEKLAAEQACAAYGAGRKAMSA